MAESQDALRRAAMIYALLAAVALAIGIAGSVLGHHRVLLSVAASEYFTAALLATYTSFPQSRGRRSWNGMTDEERDEAFAEQMWLFGIAGMLGATGAFFQFVL
jgi:hypothetical protein